MAASEAASNGEHAKAVEAFSKVVVLAPSPLVYAKRADAFLKLKKPNAAIRDCDKVPPTCTASNARATTVRLP